jgi:hypothetical protein
MKHCKGRFRSALVVCSIVLAFVVLWIALTGLSSGNPQIGGPLAQIRYRYQKLQLLRLHRSIDVQPIEFYGKVVDQDQNPIPDVQIDYILYPTPLNNEKGIGRLQSDAAGHFSIKDLHGSRIAFGLKKTGYIPSGTGGSFSLFEPATNRYTPDPKNPKVVIMRKSRGPEALVQIDQSFKSPEPSGSILIDVVTGTLAQTGGDLRVTVHRQPPPPGKFKFDWNYILEPVDGGLKFADSLESYWATDEAPTDGYTNRFEARFDSSKVKWYAGDHPMIFLRSRNGHVHSKLSLSVTVNPDNFFGVSAHGIANTNSTNWEPPIGRVK